MGVRDVRGLVALWRRAAPLYREAKARAHGVLGLVLVAGLVVACATEPSRTKCGALMDSEAFEEAATVCVAEYEASGDGQLGLLAATALRKLARIGEVKSLAERLEGEPEAGAAWYEAAQAAAAAGDIEGGLASALKSQELCLASQDHEGAAKAAYFRGYYFWRQNRPREIFEASQMALREARLAGDRVLELKASNVLAFSYYTIGALEEALAVVDGARRLLEPGDAAEDLPLRNQEALVYLAQGRHHLARQTYERLLVDHESTASNNDLRAVHLNLVSLQLALKDLPGARLHLEKGWKLADQETNLAGLYLSTGRVAFDAGDFEAARQAFRDGLASDPIPNFRWQLAYRLGKTERQLGNLAESEAAYRRSIDVIEAIRADLTYDELKEWLVAAKRRPHEELFTLQVESKKISDALETYERVKARTFVDASLASSEAPSEPSSRADPLARLDRLNSLLPLMTRSAAVEPRPLVELLPALVGKRVNAYFFANGDLWLLRLDARGEVAVRRLGAAEDATLLVERFLEDPDDREGARLLGLLLMPDEPAAARDVLYVVPDGPLTQLPFAGLVVDGQYLVERHVLTLVPSFNSLAWLAQSRGQSTEVSVVLADPLRDLPAAAREGMQVAARLGVTARLGESANLEAFRGANEGRLLHLATHTGLGGQGPWLALADTRLTATAILEERLAPAFVFLASCSSAATRGEGVWGSLGAAFLAAGGRSAVASLWSVEDETAHDLAEQFYEGDWQSPAHRLAFVQRQWAREGRPASEWAPFVHLGLASPELAEEQEEDAS